MSCLPWWVVSLFLAGLCVACFYITCRISSGGARALVAYPSCLRLGAFWFLLSLVFPFYLCDFFELRVAFFFFSFFFFLSLSFMYFLSPSMYPLGCWRTYTCVSDSVVSVELGCDTICPPIARERFQPALELQAGTARSTQNTCTSVYGM